MRRYRATKIIATLGPTSTSKEIIEKLFLSGADIFRLNFSHGTHEDHAARYHILRELEKKYERPIGIMQDLQGPKLRVGTLAEEITLLEGQSFNLDLMKDKPGDQKRVALPHPEILEAMQEGAILLLNDGRIRLQVTAVKSNYLQTQVLVGGSLSSHKGLNIPGVALPISPLTPKDRTDLAFGLSLGVDWIALSFVQHPEDIKEARDLIGDQAGLIAKIEKPLAVQHIKEIVQLSDAIMIARGDLGVEMLPEDVPSIQKKVIRECRTMGRPVIVATQMLETMVQNPTPTRAEASDVASAVYEGVDCVMLSAETASGKYPVEAVALMTRIIERVESDTYYRTLLDAYHPLPDPTVSDAITAAARKILETLHLKAMVTLTTSGSTTLRAARERPNAPIIALTPDRLTAHLLALTWGVHPIHLAPKVALKPLPDIVDTVCHLVLEEGFANLEDDILVTLGAQFNHTKHDQVFQPGSTRGLFILKVRQTEAP